MEPQEDAMPSNRIDAAFTARQRDKAKAVLATLLAEPLPFLMDLSAEDRATLPKFDDTSHRQQRSLRRDLTVPVIEIATALRARHGLATPDAIQAASCLHSSASLFVTNDLVFRRVPQLNVYVP